MDFQSIALPTELSRLLFYFIQRRKKRKNDEVLSPSIFLQTDLTGFEPAISSVTGKHVRPLHHRSKFWLANAYLFASGISAEAATA